MRRYLATFVGVILLIIFVVFIFNRGSRPAPVKKEQKALHEYASTGATAILTLQGKVVGDDQYRSVRITVGRSFRRIEVLSGYQAAIEKSAEFSNTQEGYDTFLRALALHGFTKDRKTDTPDERGVCPTGNRYIYELKDSGRQLQRTWSTSCSTGQGSFAGKPVIKQLFQAQITDYGKFISGVPVQ